MIQKLLRVGLPLLVLGICGAIGVTLLMSAPAPERRRPPPILPVVDALRVQPQNYLVTLESRGTVTPRTESTLIPEVSGQVVTIADNLRKGGFFEPGDLLVQIDPRNYQNAVTIARAELAQRNLQLEEETARAAQALHEWEQLGMAGEPDPLVVRAPQLDSARAALAAAAARLSQAEIDLERTRVVAPYAGRVLEKEADVGQYVTPGTVLARIYAVDYVEVRLPLTNRQIAFLELPELYRGGGLSAAPIPVTIKAEVGNTVHEWQGRIVRAEGAIDTASRQWFVVAQVDDPYSPPDGRPPLKVGQFVLADIQGIQLSNVYVVPDGVLNSEQEVVTIDAGGTVKRRQVEVLLERDDHSVLSGLQADQRVALSALPYAADGARVEIASEYAQVRAGAGLAGLPTTHVSEAENGRQPSTAVPRAPVSEPAPPAAGDS